MTSRALWATILILIAATPLLARVEPLRDDVPTATVLCYHIVESPQDARMEISRDTFRQQMRYLAMTGYNVIPLRELYEFVTGKRQSIPRNAVVITIDDGWRSTYTEVFPEMQKRKFPFTIFIYPKIVGQTSHALTWKQVKEMSDAGVDIQSHSLSHPFLTQRRHTSFDDRAYAAWLTHELADSKKILERETGREVEFLAYPYGDYDHNLAASVAKAGYAAALTCDYGRVKRGSDPLRMKRMVIDKRMDFASFRHYLGAGSMRVEETMPIASQTFEPEQPIIVSAKLPNHDKLDPKSIGMALISTSGGASPFAYDARSGAISMVLSEALDALRGKYQRALVWATEAKTGKRVEASWTFRIPDQLLPQAPATTLGPASVAPAGSATTSSSSVTASQQEPVAVAAAPVTAKHAPK